MEKTELRPASVYQIRLSGSFGFTRSVCGYEPRVAGASALDQIVISVVFGSNLPM